MYRDFKQAGHRGLQHVAHWTESCDADLARMESQGFRVKMSGRVGPNGRFAYFDREGHPGTVIELSEVIRPKGRLFELIRRCAIDWDGSDPVRPFPDLDCDGRKAGRDSHTRRNPRDGAPIPRFPQPGPAGGLIRQDGTPGARARRMRRFVWAGMRHVFVPCRASLRIRRGAATLFDIVQSGLLHSPCI